jgi:hypothetical protein
MCTAIFLLYVEKSATATVSFFLASCETFVSWLAVVLKHKGRDPFRETSSVNKTTVNNVNV